MTLYPSFQEAFQSHQAGQLHLAQTLYRQILQEDSKNSQVLHLLGVVEAQLKNYTEALDLINQAIRLHPTVSDYHTHLGNVLYEMGDLDQAVASYQQALSLNSNDSETYNNLGNVHHLQGHLAEAITCYQQALRLNPNHAEIYNNLGYVLHKQGRFQEALTCLQEAVARPPTSPKVYCNLASTLTELEHLEEAVAAYRQALSLRPESVEAQLGLATTLTQMGHLTEAVEQFEQMLRNHPDHAEVHNNFGTTLCWQGRTEEGIAHYRRALEINPTDAKVHSNLIYLLNFSPNYDRAAIFQEHQRFNEQHSLPLMATVKPHLANDTSLRRLKIGYVSPDFMRHPLAIFMESVFIHHDHRQFEIFCYYNNTTVDEVTQRFQRYADHWQCCSELSDEALAEVIRGDKIDILVDLAGHTANNRILLFARKPAPIQVFHTVGYANTTGVSAIAYRITDRYADPPEVAEAFSAEALVRLPASYYCYYPEVPTLPVNDLPALQSGYITFGSFNNAAKFNPSLFALWANVLHAVPHSKLLLMTKSFKDSTARQLVLEALTGLGISSERVILDYAVTTEDTLVAYHRVDVALDAYPFNGATTTCQALWMGIPVITLVGQTPAARAGLSILTTVGFKEWVAYTPEEYVEICRKLTSSLDSLRQLRQQIRPQMQSSPVLNGLAYTRHLERAYQQMWEGWGRGGSL